MVAQEEIGCPYCGCAEYQPWGRENGWVAVRCNACGLVYVNPRPVESSISEAARLGVHQTESGEIDVAGRFSETKVEGIGLRLREVWRAAPLWHAAGLRWLDIGAGFGELVLAAQRLVDSTSQVIGIEPCEPKVREARRRGLAVDTRQMKDVGGEWDVISLVNVLSHVPDIHAFIGEVAELLRVRGEILVVTGNGADVQRTDYPQSLSLPDHLVFAGEAHVVGALERAGLHLQSLNRFRTTLPRSRLEEGAEYLLATILRRRIGYSRTKFRSLWIRARKG